MTFLAAPGLLHFLHCRKFGAAEPSEGHHVSLGSVYRATNLP